MDATLRLALTLAAALGCGLMAGTFFAFSAFVMRAFARLPTAQGIAAMQSVNAAVLNPVFLGVFLGTTAGCAALGVWAVIGWSRPGSAWLLLGAVLYVAGTFLVTVACNVPRNEALGALDPAAPGSAEAWARYLAGWTAWNHVRTLAALAATGGLAVALASGR